LQNPLLVALGITLVGMTLLFLALLLFYGLLSLLMSAIRDQPRKAPARPATEQESSPGDEEGLFQAAAIAVALARAEAEQSPGPGPAASPAAGGQVSSWWTLHHGRRMTAGPGPWRNR
jgi:Na+-transporting methylmalonyl-CoA/oxaloacetate decarboxylase gamma subunit